jgi:hypothetical protein
MSDFFAGLMSNSLKRLLVLLLSGAVVALNGKLGLQLDVGAIAGIVSMSIAYTVQSAWRQGKAPTGAELVAMMQAAVEKAMASQPAAPKP